MSPEKARAELARLRPQIEAALAYAEGSHDFQDVVRGVLDERMQLWPGPNSAVITEIVDEPQHRRAHYFLAAGDRRELELMRPVIERWARDNGCKRLSLAGRRGWSRSWLARHGYTTRAVIMAKEL